MTSSPSNIKYFLLDKNSNFPTIILIPQKIVAPCILMIYYRGRGYSTFRNMQYYTTPNEHGGILFYICSYITIVASIPSQTLYVQNAKLENICIFFFKRYFNKIKITERIFFYLQLLLK